MPSSFARLLAGSAVVLLGTACLPPSAAPGPAARPPLTAPAPDSLAGPWTIRPAQRERTHAIETTATLLSRVDTLFATERVDTLRARLRVASSRVVGGDEERAAGLLHAYELSSGDSVPFVVPPGLSVPLPFTAVVGARGVASAIETPAAGACSVAAAALQPLRDLWVAAPRRLERDQRWSDSTTFSICRDSIPLLVRAQRTFRVVAAEVHDGETLLRIVRDSRTILTGDGMQFGEQVRIEAEGSGRMEYLVSLAGGEVVRGDGESSLSMRMTGRRRVQVLRQSARIAISSP